MDKARVEEDGGEQTPGLGPRVHTIGHGCLPCHLAVRLVCKKVHNLPIVDFIGILGPHPVHGVAPGSNATIDSEGCHATDGQLSNKHGYLYDGE